MTPRLVLNYEYYTYRNDSDEESTSNLITFDYDAVIQLPKSCERSWCQLYPRASAVSHGCGMTPLPLVKESTM